MPNHKIKYSTEERDYIRMLATKYGTNPYTGECHVETVKVHKLPKFYSIMIPIEVAEKFLIPQEFLEEDTHDLLMVKPVDGDDNYIFFRRL